jgi:subtilase family serine protease
VTAAGGTQLARAAGGRGWRERVWNQPRTYGGAGGSGCSAYVAKPPWQHDPHCQGRTVADTAAVASNVAVYEPRYGGWLLLGGTSLSAPLIAGVYGLAGNGAGLPPGSLYRHRRDLFDITAGNNSFPYLQPGPACGNDYLCAARPGYDAPTGLGTPDGTGAF